MRGEDLLLGDDPQKTREHWVYECVDRESSRSRTWIDLCKECAKTLKEVKGHLDLGT